MFFSNNAIFKHINWHLQNTCTCNCRDWHNLSSRASSLDHHYHYQRQVKRRCHSKLHEEFICTNCFNRICVQQNSNIASTGITNLSIQYVFYHLYNKYSPLQISLKIHKTLKDACKKILKLIHYTWLYIFFFLIQER